MKESRKARSSVLKRLFYDYLASQGLKRTQQRDLILDTFLSSEHHVNVDDLIRRVRESDPQTGYATVYRTVNLFLESGIAQEVRLSDS
ncbi:MAG TPA: transcriptional repressor, partial [Acidobacteriota bacterium]|nr:transcriptional repressor [Acidobacteriota bacterium]